MKVKSSCWDEYRVRILNVVKKNWLNSVNSSKGIAVDHVKGFNGGV